MELRRMDISTASAKKAAAVAFIDYFVNVDLQHNPDLLSRARFLALAILAEISIYLLLLALHILSLISLNPIIQLTAIVNGAVAGVLLYRLKQHGNYAPCGVVMILQGWICIIGTTAITGGPNVTPTMQLLSIPCVMAFFLGGNYWGATMALLSIGAVVFLSVIQSMGFQFPHVVSSTEFTFSHWFLLPINLAVMTMLALVYEITYGSVKQQRDLEHQKYLQLAATDPLTGLANRRMFDETLAARVALYGRLTPARKFALFYLDLDKFKPINDQFGHNIGDEVLNAVSARLRLALRGADFVGRHGGDEFLMLLDSVHDVIAAEALAKRLLQLIQEPIKTSAGTMCVGSSIGIALFPDHAADFTNLQRAADHAMYEAKRESVGYKIFLAGIGR